MSLARGARIGPYEVLEPLGEGGMGEVWRARDPRLQREVALKVLPDAFVADAERLARFERESQVLASLNHPHIATIYGVEDAPGGRAIAMELVPGPGLDVRIAAGPLPMAEALAIARDVAGALESAHEHGVVHRDLKPGNLKLSTDGRVKVLDFGLAKAGTGAVGGDLSRSPTVLAATAAGTLVGTAAYMSPEQARGAAVDRRADIWAFGCVLYEMLTGRRVFDGGSIVDVLGAIVRADPDWAALPRDTAPAVLRLLERCLRKDPRNRLRDIGDARVVLEDVIAGRYADAPTAPARAAPATPIRVHAAWGGVLVAIAALIAWAPWKPDARGTSWPLRKLEFTVQDPIVSTWTRALVAPDGHAVAYGAGTRLWVRRFDRLDPLELRGSEQGERPFWSPDSTQVAYSARRKLWKVSASGGDPTPVCDLPGTGRIIAGVWRPDGVIVFSSWYGALYQVPADGGDAAVFYEDRAAIDFHELTLLPDGKTLLFVPHTAVANLAEITAVREGRRTTVLPAQPRSQVDMPRYSPSGHLVYTRQGANEGIWAVPFSPDTLAARGQPFRVVAGSWVADLAGDGTLVYTVGNVPHQIRWVDRSGKLQASLGSPYGQLTYPALSPDGTRVAVAGSDASIGAQNDKRIWIYDSPSGHRERLPTVPEQTNDGTPEWSPDGRYVVYVEYRRNPPVLVWRGVRDGSMPTFLTIGRGRPSFSPDGRTLAFSRVRERSDSDIFTIPFRPGAPPAEPTVVLDGSGNERSPRFSPDGRFLAYESDEGGRPEVYLRRYPLTGERWVVSTGGGGFPLWHRKGTELFYRSLDGAVMSVTVSLGPSPSVGEPRELFTDTSAGIDSSREYDVSQDGQHFLVVGRSTDVTAKITVVQNWASEFTR